MPKRIPARNVYLKQDHVDGLLLLILPFLNWANNRPFLLTRLISSSLIGGFVSLVIWLTLHFGNGALYEIDRSMLPLAPKQLIGSQAFTSIVLGLCAVLSTVYWSFDAKHGRHWQYCAGLFNEIITQREKSVRDQIASCLALDIMHLRLWADPMFSEFFYDEVSLALKDMHSLDIDEFTLRLSALNSGQMGMLEVYSVLRKRNARLADCSGAALASGGGTNNSGSGPQVHRRYRSSKFKGL